jgi:teichuronic acid biosynthesis glycosyltransferase TuaC
MPKSEKFSYGLEPNILDVAIPTYNQGVFIPEQEQIRVLFVSSGNSRNYDVAPFIKVQGESLGTENINVSYFKIVGKGFFGYLKNIWELRKELKKRDFDIIHAHFTLSAWVAVMAFPRIPIVLSLMGTDAFGRINNLNRFKFYNRYLTFLTYLIQPFVSFIIAKSSNIRSYVWMKDKCIVLPNGVDLTKFSGDRKSYAKQLGLNPKRKHILFLGNRKDINKNFDLLKRSTANLEQAGFEILTPYPISHQKVALYLSTVDVLVMCSLKEGSPNVVKEAMASNCKGVFTDVGDVKEIVSNTKGYSIVGNDPVELEQAIIKVSKEQVCEGRERLIEIQLDSTAVAKKIRLIYEDLLKGRETIKI